VFRRGKIVTTLALGSKRLYDFYTKIPASTSLRWTGSTILEIIARQQNFVAINATTEVDFYGQCASETVAGQYYWVEGRPDGTRSMFLKLLGSQWLPAVPELHQRLSSAPPARIADIGVGSGWSSIAMARAYPDVLVDGYDLDELAIGYAQQHARDAGLDGRVTSWPVT
jgi:2-polyprenyl-3-methyl-5-hydroxy-6-metoxy-1,4-benzoquinol methylase